MSKKVWKIITLSTLMFCCVVSFFILTITVRKVNAQDLFVADNGMTIATDEFIPSNAAIDENRASLLLKGKQGAVARLDKELSGTFATEFRVVSENIFSADDWKKTTANTALDLGILMFRFTDTESGRFFELCISGTSNDVITPMAYVVTEGFAYGKTYYKDSDTEKNTIYNNYSGLYTKLNGTSFCNLAMLNGTLTSPKANRILFDPSSMRVYAYAYGAESDVENKLLVADLRDPNVFGQTGAFDSFDKYRVEVRLQSVVSANDAKVFVYNVNGLDLSGDFGNGTSAVSLAAKPVVTGVKDEKYVLPEPTVFTIVGTVPSEINVAVRHNGEAVSLYNSQNESTDAYSKGVYFTPGETGVYTIAYTAGAKSLPLSIDINVYASDHGYFLELNGSYDDLVNNEAGVNGEITLFPASAVSDMYYYGTKGKALINIYKDGQPLSEYTGISAEKESRFHITQAGTYRIDYVEAYGGKELESFEFTAGSNVPFYELPEMDSFISVGTRMAMKNCKATYGGITKEAVPVVSFPDGTLRDSFYVKFDISGQYYISYYVNFDGVVYKYVRSVTVGDNAQSLFTAAKGISVTENYQTESYPYDKGLLITSASGGNAVFNLPVSLSDFTLGSNLLDFSVIPTQKGRADFQKIVFTLTDVNDSANYFTVSLNASQSADGRNTVRVKAGAAGQSLCGLYNGAVDVSALGGTEIMANFTGEGGFGYDSIKIYYDNSSKSVYAANTTNGENVALVSSFRDTDFYSEKLLWKGFSSDLATLSVSIEGQSNADAKILIKSIGKQSFRGEFKDSVPPSIQLDFGDYSYATIPVAFAGIGYPVFSAMAYDSADRAYKDITVHIYKDYGKDSMSLCDSDVFNGVFYPSSDGNYTIQYLAADNFGNTASYCLPLKVEKYYPIPTIMLGFAMPESVNPGESIPVGKYTVDGGCGNLITKVYLKNLANGEKTLIEDEEFKPVNPGNYEIDYEITDYTNTTEIKRFAFTVNQTTAPTFISLPDVPEYLLNGKKYDTSTAQAVYYSEADKDIEKAEIVCEVEYNGVKTKLSGDGFVPDVTNDGDMVKIYFTATNSKTGQKTQRVFTSTVIKPYDQDEMLRLERLFLTENVDEIIPSSDRISFISNGDGVPTVSFMNELVANGFALSFKFGQEDGERINYSSVKINLYDAYDESVCVSLFITKRASTYTTSYFGVNGVGTTEITSNFFGNTNTDFKLRYSATENSIIDGNNASVLGKVTKMVNGKEFHGFASNKIRFSLELVGVTGKSAISIQTICNQPISNTTGDYIAPQINRLEEINNFVTQGDKVVVPAAVASDVVVGSCTPLLTVTAPDGTTVVEKISIAQAYEFVASQHGVYRVFYYVSDGSQDYTASFTITARSTVIPEFTIDGKFKDGKAGGTISVPKAIVTNVEEGSYTMYIVAISPYGEYTLIEDNAFVPQYKGKYIIRYFVRDNYYNVTVKDFVINVD